MGRALSYSQDGEDGEDEIEATGALVSDDEATRNLTWAHISLSWSGRQRP